LFNIFIIGLRMTNSLRKDAKDALGGVGHISFFDYVVDRFVTFDFSDSLSHYISASDSRGSFQPLFKFVTTSFKGPRGLPWLPRG
jgi:hypothetical protein